MTEDIKEEGILVDQDGNELKPEPKKVELEADDTDQDDQPIKAEEAHDDEQGEEGETEEDAEARRERNRQRRRENKDRRKDFIESLKRQIESRDELLSAAMQRLDAVERRTNGADVAAVNVEFQKAADAYNYFKMQHAEAVSAANGQLAAEAIEKMNAAAERARQLDNIRKAAQNPRQPATPPLDPRTKILAEDWLERNPWYDVDRKDRDSKRAFMIDLELVEEGYNPITQHYWQELDARLKEILPHRYNGGYNKPQGKPRPPVAGSGRESSSAPSGGYKLSAERVTAIKDAGKWDDPKERAAMIKAFQNYDAAQAKGDR